MNLHEALIKTGLRFVGVKEVGANAGPEVEAFQKAVDGKAQKESWCMAFVQFCVMAVAQAAGLFTESKLFKSEHCLTVWNKSPKEMRRNNPEPGFVVIWQHVGTTNGHTGIVTRVLDDEHFETVEGNTGSGSTVERNGDGVYTKVRRRNPAGSMKIVGFLDPWHGQEWA